MALTKITTSVVAVNSLTAANIADNSIDATKIANNQILARHIAAGSLTDQLGTLPSATISGNLVVDTTTLVVDSSNNRVGIGTASPASPLTVHADGIGIRLDGTADTTRRIFFRSTSSSNPAEIYADGTLKLWTEDAGTDIRFHTNSNGTNNERMRIDSSGNVGIGTTPTAGKLDILGGASGVSVRVRGDVGAGAYYYGYMFDGTDVRGTTQTNIFYSGSAIAANTTITDYAGIRIDQPNTSASGAVVTNNYAIYSSGSSQKSYFAGKVGIGTTTPESNHAKANNLVVGGGGAGGMAVYNGTAEGWYAFSRSNANNTDAYDGGMSYTDRVLKLHTNAGSERMRIDASGRVGLGSQITSNQASTYDSRANDFVISGSGDTGMTIAGGGSENLRLQFTVNGDTGLNRGEINYDNNDNSLAFATAGSNRMSIDSDGDVKISGTFGTNSSTAFGSMGGRLTFDTDYSDTQRGPNKIVLQEDGTWISGLGISNNSTDLYTGGAFNFVKGTTSTLTIDTSGRVTAPYQPFFSVKRSGNQTFANAAWVDVIWNSETTDTGGNFASNTFTAPVAGVYLFTGLIGFNTITATGYVLARLTCSSTGDFYITHEQKRDGGGDYGYDSAISDMITLAANETVKIQVFASGGGNHILRADTRWQGRLMG